jgi:putative transposase
MDDYDKLNHTMWDCKYHVVFIPKYRKKALYGELRRRMGEMSRALASQKECKILEGHLMPDHVHMLISIPPKYSVAQVIGYIKGKSTIHVARTFFDHKRNFVGQHFWARGYFVSTVGRDEVVIREYIRNQEQGPQQTGAVETRIGRATFRWLTRPLVSGHNSAALGGSHLKAPGFAGG